MKTLKLLSKKFFFIFFFSLISLSSYSDEKPVDIWEVNKKKAQEENKLKDSEIKVEESLEDEPISNIYEMQTPKENDFIKLESDLNSQEIKIIGLYDPEDNGLDINMWSNSNGDQLKNIFAKLNKLNLSEDANEIIKITLFTNSYYPKNNITEKEFLKFKSNWLIKNSDLDLIEEYLIKNQIINIHPKLTRYLVDYYLSNADLDKACNFFNQQLQN